MTVSASTTFAEARAEHGDQRDRQQDARETPAACRSTRLITSSTASAEVAGDRAEQHADRSTTPTTTASPTSSEMRAPGEHPREDVAPELVEAERMRQARRLEPQRQLLRRRVVRRQRPARRRRPRSPTSDDDDGRRGSISLVAGSADRATRRSRSVSRFIAT